MESRDLLHLKNPAVLNTRTISISEIQQFLRCRRMWDIQSPWRQNLVKIGMPSAALYIGSGVHEVLEANALGKDWRQALDKWKQDEITEFVVYYSERVGTAPSSSELEMFDEAHETVTVLMERYFKKYGEDNPLGENFEYVAVEQTCEVPIPGTVGKFTFTLDGLARDKRTDRLWVVEHKTYATSPDMDRLSTDAQITAYAWGVSAILGEDIAGFLYDGISKKLPSEPALLKSGRLSEAFTQTIDYQSYAAAIERHELYHQDYTDILTRLAERDALPQTPFYTRWKIDIHPAQVQSFASYIADIYTDMVSNPHIYPNFRFDGCWDCGVRELCKSMQLGDDVQWVKETYYMQGRGSQSFQRRKGTPTVVDKAALLASIP